MNKIQEALTAVYEDCRLPCPACSDSRKKKYEKTLSVTINVDGSKVYFCHHCGESGSLFKPKEKFLQERKVTTIEPPAAVDKSRIEEFFSARGILWSQDIDLPVISGRRYFNGHGELDAVGFIYGDRSQPQAIKWRAIDKKAFTQEGAARQFYGIEFIPEDATELIIVEGECDALALASAGIPAVSCPNGAPMTVSDRQISPEDDNKFSYIWEARKLLDKSSLKKVILATDNDQAGHALAEEIARRIGRAKCWGVTYPEGCKDANDVIQRHGAQALRDAVEKSQPLPLEGVYTASSYIKEVQDIYNNGVGKGESTGIATLDDLFTIAEGQLTVVTGVPSSGKSEFVDQLMINLAQKSHWQFAVCSFENPVHFHLAKLSEKIVGKPFYETDGQRMSNDELIEATDFIDKHFVFLDPQVNTIDSILDRAKQAVMRLGNVRGLIIDPYNYLEKNLASDENQSISSILSKVTTFARAHLVHVFFIAHPSKMYAREDGSMPIPTGHHVSGSASWWAKTDLGLTVHRGLNDEVEIHCWKSRFKWIAKLGAVSLGYDKLTGRYSDLDISSKLDTSAPNPKHWTDIDLEWKDK